MRKRTKTRPTKYCECSKQGKCFDRWQKTSDGIWSWVIHCKTLDKITNQAVGKFDKLLKNN